MRLAVRPDDIARVHKKDRASKALVLANLELEPEPLECAISERCA